MCNEKLNWSRLCMVNPLWANRSSSFGGFRFQSGKVGSTKYSVFPGPFCVFIIPQPELLLHDRSHREEKNKGPRPLLCSIKHLLIFGTKKCKWTKQQFLGRQDWMIGTHLRPWTCDVLRWTWFDSRTTVTKEEGRKKLLTALQPSLKPDYLSLKRF